MVAHVLKCKCDACGLTYSSPRNVPCAEVRHNCIKTPPALGDYVEQWLTKHGITQESYKAAKESIGLPPTCKCDKVKAYLNKLGKHFGIGS